ncbi:MAG: class I SAM-dependent methyltransferase [Anaerolineae bacterium]|nr:class I SAM-dependent methyltransferase [Anaerolineae bacterium]
MNQLNLEEYYALLAARFDQAARLYDATYGNPSEGGRGNALIGWLHDEFCAMVRETIPAGGALIDLGCGTGGDALTMAQAGYGVLGIDVSPAMVRQAQTKMAVHGIQRGVKFQVMPASQIATLDERGPFQGAYASLGALNTEPNLVALSAGLHELLEPGAAFVAMVMNRRCLFEIWYNLRRFQPSATLDRSGEWVESRAGVGGVQAPVTFYTPAVFAAPFAGHFTVEAVQALPVWLPPVHMHELYNANPESFAGAMARDRRLRAGRGWRAWGDHFVIVLRHGGV